MLLSDRQKRILAVAIPVLVGISLRLTGIHHGKPDLVYHPDVAKQTSVAKHIYAGDLNIRKLFGDDFERTMYPYGTAVMLGNIAKLGGSGMKDVHRWTWAVGMRYLSIAIISLATLALLTVLSRNLSALHTFLLGLLLMAEPVNAQFSHYGMNDVPLLGFLYAALAASMLMLDEKQHPLWSFISGAAAGIGFAVKYQGLLGLAFPGICWLLLLRKRSFARSALSAAAVAAGFAAGSVPLCPMLTSDPVYFVRTFPGFMQWQAGIMGEAIPIAAKIHTNLTGLWHIIWIRGWLLLAPLASIAAVNTWRHRKDSGFVLPVASSAVLCIMLLAAVITSRDILRQNDIMPAAAFALVSCSVGSFRSNGIYRRAAEFIAALTAAVFIFSSTADALAFGRKDTRESARDWCNMNLPPDATVVCESYVVPPDRHDLRITKRKFLGYQPAADMVFNRQSDFFIASSLSYLRFYDRGLPYFSPESQAVYRHLQEHYDLIMTFKDSNPMLYAQPEIRIYRRRSP